jgi:transketolase
MINSELLAKKIRQVSLKMVHQANASHIGGALSMADILAVLYSKVMHIDPVNPKKKERDRFILSKGHACTSLYATLGLCGFFPLDELSSYGQDGSKFLSHTSHFVPGVEISAGSLGHGLPIACGLAFAAKKWGGRQNIYCLVGDGEMDEGSNWEAILFAAQFKLNNLCLIIDYNKIQSLGNTNEVINLEPLHKKFEAFNWNPIEINGHDHTEIYEAFLSSGANQNEPSVIIANTIKGKGVSFMENNLLWHYKSPTTELYNKAMEELQ